MNRRDFVVGATATTLLSACLPRRCPCSDTTGDSDVLPALSRLPDALAKDATELLEWVRAGPWNQLLEEASGARLRDSSPTASELTALLPKRPTLVGFTDFAGRRLITPGRPELSLLYHALAHPRVTLQGGERADLYPSLQQIDTLENYIYALDAAPDLSKPEELAVAMLAYQYRPGSHTPHGAHAALVFSRTGISRIGEAAMNYDRRRRSHTTLPAAGVASSKAAVTPARYGLFLVRGAPANSEQSLYVERRDRRRSVLMPIRKIFAGDFLIGEGTLSFAESHINEKLGRLARARDRDFVLFDMARDSLDAPPFKRTSSDSRLAELSVVGSSVLVSSPPAPLVRPACRSDGSRLAFKVPSRWEGKFGLGNRRYSTFRLLGDQASNRLDYGMTEVIFASARATRFGAPRNAPHFVNIRNEQLADGTLNHLGSAIADFEGKVKGAYSAALFEDSICDGCVMAEVNGIGKTAPLKGILERGVLPAFSLVTAPDLFPWVSGTDLERFDRPGKSHFFEGGTESLATARLPANPGIPLPKPTAVRRLAFPAIGLAGLEDAVSDTVTAVVSGPKARPPLDEPEVDAEHGAMNFLPDGSSFFMSPGWDVTYSSDPDSSERYLATFGLGSPFPEDMKLCAAGNGMWPAASPDAARTFLGSMEPIPFQRPPTAVPLMDSELGFHEASPGRVRGRVEKPTLGWDGEQGPYLVIRDTVLVNYAEIGRVDYVENAERGLFDFSLLRDLRVRDFVSRMDALRLCIDRLDHGQVKNSDLWLVSAEEVADWSKGATGNGIPVGLFGSETSWATTAQPGLSGAGFLYVFVRPQYGTPLPTKEWKRSELPAKKTYVCQIGASALATCELTMPQPAPTKKLAWVVRDVVR